MASKKITELTAVTALTDDDLICVVDDPAGTAATKKITRDNLFNAAVGVSDLKPGTDGELITWGADGNPATVAVGTATHVLTSNGAGAAPTFQAPAAGGQTLYDAIVAASGGDYTTVGAAISGGATSIFVKEGSYTEGAITTAVTDITIVGANPETTVLSFTSNAFTVSGARLNLQNLKLSFTTGTIEFTGDDIRMVNCHYTKSGAGGSNIDADRVMLIGNKFDSTQTDDVIQLQISAFKDDCLVNGNTFIFNATETSTSATIKFDTDYGTITGNIFKCNVSGTGYLVSLNSNGIAFTGNALYANTQSCNLLVIAASNTSVTGNTFDGGVLPINIQQNDAGLIFGNSFSGAQDGIYVGGFRNTIVGNKFLGSGTTSGYTAIQIAGKSNNYIASNWMRNYDVGVQIDVGSSDNNIIGNYFQNPITTTITDSGSLNHVEGNMGDEITNVDEVVYKMMTNGSGAQVDAGDIVTLKADATGYTFTTTTTQGDDLVYGMAAETIANTAQGFVQVKGKTTALKVDGTTDIAIGDFIGTFTTAKIGQKAAAGDMAIAIALEAYIADDSSGVIDALLITPRKI